MQKIELIRGESYKLKLDYRELLFHTEMDLALIPDLIWQYCGSCRRFANDCDWFISSEPNFGEQIHTVGFRSRTRDYVLLICKDS